MYLIFVKSPFIQKLKLIGNSKFNHIINILTTSNMYILSWKIKSNQVYIHFLTITAIAPNPKRKKCIINILTTTNMYILPWKIKSNHVYIHFLTITATAPNPKRKNASHALHRFFLPYSTWRVARFSTVVNFCAKNFCQPS